MDKIKGMSCYLQEQTIGITAQLVVRDLDKLDIAPSMQSLVSKTEQVLELIAGVDLKAVCGEESLPVDTEACTSALGSRNMHYGILESQLDAWRPYL